MELKQEVKHGQSTTFNYQLAGKSDSSNPSMTQVMDGDWTRSRDWTGLLGRLDLLGRLSRLEFLAVTFSLIITLACIVGVLVMHFQNSQLQMATDQYVQKTAEIQKQTKIMSESITQQYNYGKISEVAKEQNMTIDKSQIRNVEHE